MPIIALNQSLNQPLTHCTSRGQSSEQTREVVDTGGVHRTADMILGPPEPPYLPGGLPPMPQDQTRQAQIGQFVRG